VTTRPKVLGPAGFYDREWFDTFLHNVRPGVVDGVTHHIYNLGAGMYISIEICYLSNLLGDNLFDNHSFIKKK